MNLYLDFDGVIVDSITVTYNMMKELNIDLKDDEKVTKFYKELNWFKLLNDINQINNSVEIIKKLQMTNIYDLSILTSVNSQSEVIAKNNYIRNHNLNIPIISVPREFKKNEVVSAKSAILVDDFNSNLYEWEKAGGIGVKFSNKKSDDFITINNLNELSNKKFIKKLIKKI
jgi:hypothetical protein